MTAHGFPPNTNVFVEQCDGTSTATPGWSPTINCDNLTSPAPVISTAGGVATFTKDDPNLGFTPFKGESPGGLFNCLSLHDASPNNGVPDFRNCTVRVSTNNAAVTGDQVFLNILLPDGGAAPVESCRISGIVDRQDRSHEHAAPAKPKANKFKGARDGGYRGGRNVRADGHDQVPDHHGLGEDQGRRSTKGAVCTCDARCRRSTVR